MQLRFACRLRNFQKSGGFFYSIVLGVFLQKTANHESSRHRSSHQDNFFKAITGSTVVQSTRYRSIVLPGACVVCRNCRNMVILYGDWGSDFFFTPRGLISELVNNLAKDRVPTSGIKILADVSIIELINSSVDDGCFCPELLVATNAVLSPMHQPIQRFVMMDGCVLEK